MKTTPAFRPACLGLLALSVTAPILNGEENKTAPAKTHVLFMGADLDVQRDRKFYRVENVTGSEFRIKVGKREVFVPTRNRSTTLKVGHGLKLSAASVQLDGLQGGPSYTPANDPVRKFNAASGAAGGAAAVRDLAHGRMIELSLEATYAAMSANASSAGSAPATQAAAVGAEAKFQDALQQAAAADSLLKHSSQYNTGLYADQMQKELAEGNYDAMEVSFKISSPVELDDPHMVILFKFQQRDARPGEEGMLIHAKELDPIGPKPKYIRVREGGLPRGFKYLDCEVHIFNRGEEVATNVSSKRVELTRDEARQYIVIEHIGANKGTTVPAAAVPGTVPPARLKALSLDQLNRTYYARVARDGSLIGVFADESCSLRLDDEATVAAAGEVFFKPALYEGRPVEGIVRLRLGEI